MVSVGKDICPRRSQVFTLLELWVLTRLFILILQHAVSVSTLPDDFPGDNPFTATTLFFRIDSFCH